MPKARLFATWFLLFLVSACAASPVFTVEVYRTTTPFEGDPTITPFVEMLDSFTATPSPLPVLPLVPTKTTVMPADFSPILYGKKYDANTFFLLLGAVQGNTWLAQNQAAAQFGGESDYDVYTLAKKTFPVHGHSPEFSHPGQSYFIGTDVTLDEPGMVGVLHGWPIRQADTQQLSPDNETYQQVVIDWLEQNGISAPELGTMHIFRVDLEADGVDEIFISATHLDDVHIAKSGEYSILLMRKVVGNSAVTVPLVSDVYTVQQEVIQPPYYSFVNFIDLNRDGILEVVVEIQGWEKFGAIVYQVNGRAVTEALR